MTDDERMLRLALDEAPKGNPSPNPHVGAVLVDPRTGAVVGRGYHPKPGDVHAEVMAIAQAGARARGATLYVTLEPCNHHGRTPPCTEAILAAGIPRVVVGCADPNRRVLGGGVERLRAAGVEVVTDVLVDECEDLIAPFAVHCATSMPYVRLKLATSIDARLTAQPQTSQWLTGPASRAFVHGLRARADAIAVGSGTVLADDPQLTVREAPMPQGRALPCRVVFDRRGRISATSRLVRTAHEQPVLVLLGPEVSSTVVEGLRGHGVDACVTDGTLGGALALLAKRGIVDLLVEGGAALAAALLQEGLVAELNLLSAPVLLGAHGLGAFAELGAEAARKAGPYRLHAQRALGDDALTVWRARTH